MKMTFHKRKKREKKWGGFWCNVINPKRYSSKKQSNETAKVVGGTRGEGKVKRENLVVKKGTKGKRVRLHQPLLLENHHKKTKQQGKGGWGRGTRGGLERGGD